MSGALHRSLGRRGWADGGRVRGYAGGGAADDPAPDDDPYSGMPPPIPPQGGPPPAARQGALASANAAGAQAPEGALTRNLPQQGGPPDQQDPDAQRKMFDMNKAMMILRSSSGINPMLMAAGAMLAPTRTGGFSESLGNAFSAYGKAGEQERASDETMASRLLQAQWQNDYRQATVAVQQQKANTQSDLAGPKIALMGAQSSMDMARAAMLTARAAAGAAAHVTPGDLQAQAMNSLLTPGPDGTAPVNPDTGKPFTKIEAFQATQAAMPSVQGANIRAGTAADRLAALKPLLDARVEALQGTADYHNQLIALKAQGLSDAAAKAQLDAQIRQQQTDIMQQRVDQQQPLVDAKVQAIQDTKDYHDSVQAMKQQGIPHAQAIAVGKLAASIMAAKPGTTWTQALAQAQSGLPGHAALPPKAPGTTPAPAAGGASAPAATPQGQHPPPPAAYPNAQWSDKYGSYLIPGGAPGKWTNVGVGQAGP